VVPLADHHWSRASASCRARCSPYRRSEVLRASQLPALLILRQPTYPFPSRSSASSPSAFFRIVSFRIYLLLLFFFVFTRWFGFFRFHVFFFYIFCTHFTDFRFLQPHTQFSVRRHASITSVSVSAFPRHFPIEIFVVFSCVSIFIHILLYRCGGRSDGSIYIFPYFWHMRAVASVDRAYYLRWFFFFFF